jgi:hypothetical protein
VTPTATIPTGPTETATPFEPICELKAGVCVGGDNDGQDCTAAAQCSAGGGTCNFDRRCVGGDNEGQPCTAAANCPGGSCPTLGDISKIELNVAALPVPLGFAIRGQIRLERGPISDNTAEMACSIISIDPINIPAIGNVCITPPDTPCEGSPGTIDCDGGSLLGIELLSDGNIGACESNAACDTNCDTYCGGIGGVQQTSGCTGHCSGSTPQPCNTDAECLNNEGCTAAGMPQECCTGDGTGTCGEPNGACNGPDPVGSAANLCQCQCVNTAAGPEARAGDFQCQLGSSLVVETAAPCDGMDVAIAVGTACIPVTSGTAEASITNANLNPEGCPGGGPPCMLPASGPAINSGAPVACENYDTGPLTGAKGVGVVNFFGSALGDIVTELFAVCK